MSIVSSKNSYLHFKNHNPTEHQLTSIYQSSIEITNNKIAIWTLNKLRCDATHILLAFYIGKKTRTELKLLKQTTKDKLVEQSILRLTKKQSIEDEVRYLRQANKNLMKELNREKLLSSRLFARLRN